MQGEIITTQIPGDDQARAVACIPLRALPMWLATINASKVAPEAREALVAFQARAADALYKHFLAPPAPPAAELARELAELRAQVEAHGAELRQLAAERAPRTMAPHPLAEFIRG